MGKAVQLPVGKRFGRLTVESFAGIESGCGWHWCICKCRMRVRVQTQRLTSGNSRSCGCLRKERVRRALRRRNRKHGKYGTRLYRIWHGMIQRCHYPRHEAYARYGGANIMVCLDWKESFQAFYDWAMANGYKRHLTLDRIENDKGYWPFNCQWSTTKYQRRNQRRNKI